MIWWCRSDPINFSMPYSQIADLTLTLCKLKHLKYKERLERLKLPTLRYRRTRGDMIEVYKILTESYYKSVNLELELHKKSVTRGHNLKLVNSRCHYDLRKYSSQSE